jgi:LysR family glycine cleavage system transcriptional activator
MRIPLNALRTFEAVASRLSFSKGARALNVSPAAVSSQIRALEELLNQPLFHRKGRQISLTPAGRTLLPGVQRGLGELTQALRLLEEDRQGGVLNVSIVSMFLQKWLTPRLGDFYAANDQIDLRINADNALVNFAESDFHAAIRYGGGGWPDLEVHKLLDEWTVPVCSPEMLADVGPIESATDLAKHHLLHSGKDLRKIWSELIGEVASGRQGPNFDDSVSVVAAAEQGLGIGLVRWSLVAAELASGRLVRPSPLAARIGTAFYFVAPAQYINMPKVAVFRNWLTECCEAFPEPDEESPAS